MIATRRRFLIPALLFTCMCVAQTPARSTTAPGTASLLIRLEQKKGDVVSSVRPEHVFDVGDVVRFRLTSGSDGYLYVINQGSSGTYTALFPAEGTRSDNRMQRGSDYLVPSTEDGWFAIDGPAGFDIIYFLLSPTPLNVSAKEEKSAPAPSALPNSLTPRCNDAIFQARGECIDNSAGPAPLPRGVPLPPQIRTMAPNASRDIVFTNGDDEKSVTASANATAPVVYTFRLAHR
jgi:hypothetical protein